MTESCWLLSTRPQTFWLNLGRKDKSLDGRGSLEFILYKGRNIVIHLVTHHVSLAIFFPKLSHIACFKDHHDCKVG